MKKISTLYKKNPLNLAVVVDEVDPQNEWVFFDTGVKATRKYDGTAAAVINGHLYKRYDVKRGKQVPDGAIPCQEPDEITGHWPHWVMCHSNNPEDKYFLEALASQAPIDDGTYELCGPKVQNNREGLKKHELIKHGIVELAITDFSFSGLKEYLLITDIEGIVFHHPDGRMCKIRKSDFGIKP